MRLLMEMSQRMFTKSRMFPKQVIDCWVGYVGDVSVYETVAIVAESTHPYETSQSI